MPPLALVILLGSLIQVASQENECTPIYVRWPRVRLNLTSRVTGPFSLEECVNASSKDEHPGRKGSYLQSSGFNHKHGVVNECQLFQKDQISNLDGNVEYDDRYSFYWKYCVKTKEPCKSAYQYDFHIDRYMDYNESKRRILTFQVEDCLEQCLQEKSFECRSVSFNRTAGYCYLSEESRLSKPGSVRVNTNPNYRIDYYENKCHNDCFTFHHECQQNGVLVTVESKFAYTGAMYGLYDFFSCRIEPKEEIKFQYYFPFPNVSKNCSDSMSIRDDEYVLEVVLSTDNVIPLYFLTDEDLIYKAKCPSDSKVHYSASTIGAQVELVPPFSKAEAVSRVALDFSSTSAPASSSVASVENTTLALENATLNLEETSSNVTNTTDGSLDKVKAAQENATIEHEAKKPLEILPSLDPHPSISKPDERKGNKITLFVRYPKEDNETIPMESNETRHETTLSSTAMTSSSSTSSAQTSTHRTTTEKENIEMEGSGASEESTVSSTTTTTESSRSSSTSTGSSTTTETTSTSTAETTTGSTTISSTSSSSTSTSTSTTSSPPFSSTSTTTETSIATINTSTSISSSTSPSTESSMSSREITTSAQSTTTTEEDEELHILAGHSTTTSPPVESTTIPTWLYAWRFQLLSSTSTSKPSTDESSPSRKPESALSIDTSVVGIEKTKDVDSSVVATSSTSKSTVTSSTWSPTSSTSTGTRSTSEGATTSTTFAPSNTPFWPFILRTRPSTIWSAYTEASSATTTTSPSTTNGSNDSNLTTNSTSTSTSSYSSTTTNWDGWKDLNQTSNFTGLGSSSSTTSTTQSSTATSSSRSSNKILFDVYNNGQPVTAVVIGSRITMNFLPALSVPGSYMSLISCIVEPINSPYQYSDPGTLPIVMDGCQADGVGLVCPPVYSESGIKVEMEAFRYSGTSEILYSCLVRVCPYGPCPQPSCGKVDGCNDARRAPSLAISPTYPNFPLGSFGRKKRQATTLPVLSFLPTNTDLQTNLISLAGDHQVTKKLVVFNSDAELQYYLRTGNVPSATTGNTLNSFLGR